MATRAPITLWGWLPIGSNTLKLHMRNEQIPTLSVTSTRFGCCTSTLEVPLNSDQHVEVSRRCAGPFELLGLIPTAIISGFILHCIPAAFVGAPNSLGSSTAHRNLGVVWGILSLVTLVVFGCFMRPVGLRLMGPGSSKCCNSCVFESFNKQHADRLCLWLNELASNRTKPSRISQMPIDDSLRLLDVQTGLGVLGSLALNTVLLFAVFVNKCSDCGGCSDDGPPRDGCYYSTIGGRPEALVCGISLLGVSLLMARRFYLMNHSQSALVNDSPLMSVEAPNEALERR